MHRVEIKKHRLNDYPLDVGFLTIIIGCLGFFPF